MLVAKVATSESLFRLWQTFQLLADFNPFGGGASRQLALPFQPGGDAQRAIGGVLTRFVEPAHAGCEDRFQRVDSNFADQDQQLAELRSFGFLSVNRHPFDGSLQLLGRGLRFALP